MKKKDVYKMMGCPVAEPAGGDATNGVEPQAWGLVVIRNDIDTDNLGHLQRFLGRVGYYDDDEWIPHDEEQWDQLTEEEADEADPDEWGEDWAIVYFCEPFSGPYYVIPHRFLRPATKEEALAYSLNPPGPEEDVDKNDVVIAVYTDRDGRKRIAHSIMEYGDGDGIRACTEIANDGAVPDDAQTPAEIRICSLTDDQLIKMSRPLPVEDLKD
jgi:hypothetical protein